MLPLHHRSLVEHHLFIHYMRWIHWQPSTEDFRFELGALVSTLASTNLVRRMATREKKGDRGYASLVHSITSLTTILTLSQFLKSLLLVFMVFLLTVVGSAQRWWTPSFFRIGLVTVPTIFYASSFQVQHPIIYRVVDPEANYTAECLHGFTIMEEGWVTSSEPTVRLLKTL